LSCAMMTPAPIAIIAARAVKYRVARILCWFLLIIKTVHNSAAFRTIR
jgi:hypothetical protein